MQIEKKATVKGQSRKQKLRLCIDRLLNRWLPHEPKPIRIDIDREQFKQLIRGYVMQYGVTLNSDAARQEVVVTLQDIGWNVMLHEIKEAKYEAAKSRGTKPALFRSHMRKKING